MFRVCLAGKNHLLAVYNYLRPKIVIYGGNLYQLLDCRSNSCSCLLIELTTVVLSWLCG